MELGKYSFGVGDRFGMQGNFLLQAFSDAKGQQMEITPVWNKSGREHEATGTTPEAVKAEAGQAAKVCDWKGAWFVDADHIDLGNVTEFLPHADFFTIDVAKFLHKPPPFDDRQGFTEFMQSYMGYLNIPGMEEAPAFFEEEFSRMCDKYLEAMRQAGKIYQRIGETKEDFIAEVSIDEVESAQSPEELFFILGALSFYEVNLSTIAPKFAGTFLKGVDYPEEPRLFEETLKKFLQVIDYARDQFDLPAEIKLSVHTGSDKFSLYPIIRKVLKERDAGIHVKTAGTTWLEELAGVAENSAEGLEFARELYTKAWKRREELTKPYGPVVQLDPTRLPEPGEVKTWRSEKFCRTLRHRKEVNDYNPHFRQLIHTAYKIAAEEKPAWEALVSNHAEEIGEKVKDNIFRLHMNPLFHEKT